MLNEGMGTGEETGMKTGEGLVKVLVKVTELVVMMKPGLIRNSLGICSSFEVNLKSARKKGRCPQNRLRSRA